MGGDRLIPLRKRKKGLKTPFGVVISVYDNDFNTEGNVHGIRFTQLQNM